MRVKTILLILLLCSGCGIIGNTTKELIVESGNISVYFCPSDDCEGKLVGLIKNSTETVHCALFDLDLKEVIYALANKSHTADVKVVIDNVNFDDQITGEGIRLDTSSQLSHNKFCIFDNKLVFTGSFNPTERGAYKNNNNMLIIKSKYLVENYNDEFDELWQGNFSKGKRVSNPIIYLNAKKIENYFCPEDYCAWHVVQTLNNAEKSIYFMTFSFTNEDIANSVINQYGKGLDVKGVFEKTQKSKYSQFERMQGFGLNVTWDTDMIKLNPNITSLIKYPKIGKLHHKVFIIDNQTVITGSMNPTGAGDTRNDENVLIIHDKGIAQQYLDEFDLIWQRNFVVAS